MNYKEFTLRAELPEQISTEILFEIASARADGIELLCINIFNEDKEYTLPKKQQGTVIKLLKNLKGEGRIQLFATSNSFNEHKTEAYFLQNKYPEIFNSSSTDFLDESKVYIKI